MIMLYINYNRVFFYINSLYSQFLPWFMSLPWLILLFYMPSNAVYMPAFSFKCACLPCIDVLYGALCSAMYSALYIVPYN